MKLVSSRKGESPDPKLTHKVFPLPKGQSTGIHAYLDLETRKTPTNGHTMANGEVLNQRWEPFAMGVAVNDEVHLIYGGTEIQRLTELEKLLDTNLPTGEKRVIHYTASRQFDEMILRGRFTNVRRAHEDKPFYPAMRDPDKYGWKNMALDKENTRTAPPDDIPSKDVPAYWARNEGKDREQVLSHLRADVEWMVKERSDTRILKPRDKINFNNVKRGDIISVGIGESKFMVLGNKDGVISAEKMGQDRRTLKRFKQNDARTIFWHGSGEPAKPKAGVAAGYAKELERVAAANKAAQAAKAKPEVPKAETASGLRSELRRIQDEMVVKMNEIDFNNITEKEKAKYRGLKISHLDKIIEMEKRLESFKPDYSREVGEAQNYTELREIMEDRHPTLVIDDFETKVNAKIDELSLGYKDPYTRSQLFSKSNSFAATRATFRGLDAQMIKYPKIKVWRLDAACHGTHDEEVTGASCGRGSQIGISVNPRHLADVKRVMGRARANVRSGWHAANHEKAYYKNNMIHEFGHATDWRANIWPQDFEAPDGNNKAMIERNSVARKKQISGLLADVYFDEVNPKGKVNAQDVLNWLRDTKQVSGYSWDREDPSVLQDDELLAEAWTDVEINGESATPVSKALHKMIIDGMRKNKVL
jgi:hypothetical protein